MSDGATATVTTGQTAGEAAAITQQNGSAAAKVPAVGAPAGDASTTGDWRNGWDDTLKNDPALKDFKDPASLAKSYLETKKMVGMKTGVPGDNATAEERATFYKALGVPENADGYGLVVPENLPEPLKENYETDTLKWFAGVAKEANLTPQQAKAIQAAYDNKFSEFLTGAGEDVTRSEANFDAMATKIFGDKKVEALTAARADVEKYIPKELHADFANMPNSALLAVARVATAVRQELTGEDKVTNDGSEVTGKSSNDLKNEARAIMKGEDFNSPFGKGGKDAYEKAQKDVRRLFQEADALDKAGKKTA